MNRKRVNAELPSSLRSQRVSGKRILLQADGTVLYLDFEQASVQDGLSVSTTTSSSMATTTAAGTTSQARSAKSAAIHYSGGPSALLLHPSGERFTHVGPRGKTLQQYTRFAISSVLPKVRTALRFRDSQCSWLKPYASQNTHAVSFTSSVPIESVRWRLLSSSDGASDGTRKDGGGEIEIASADGHARFCLSANGRLARASFPVQVGGGSVSSGSLCSSSLRSRDAKSGLRSIPYAVVTQTFSTRLCPPAFAPALVRARRGLENAAVGNAPPPAAAAAAAAANTTAAATIRSRGVGQITGQEDYIRRKLFPPSKGNQELDGGEGEGMVDGSSPPSPSPSSPSSRAPVGHAFSATTDALRLASAIPFALDETAQRSVELEARQRWRQQQQQEEEEEEGKAKSSSSPSSSSSSLSADSVALDAIASRLYSSSRCVVAEWTREATYRAVPVCVARPSPSSSAATAAADDDSCYVPSSSSSSSLLDLDTAATATTTTTTTTTSGGLGIVDCFDVEVEVSIHEDSSCLVLCSDGFFRLYSGVVSKTTTTTTKTTTKTNASGSAIALSSENGISSSDDSSRNEDRHEEGPGTGRGEEVAVFAPGAIPRVLVAPSPQRPMKEERGRKTKMKEKKRERKSEEKEGKQEEEERTGGEGEEWKSAVPAPRKPGIPLQRLCRRAQALRRHVVSLAAAGKVDARWLKAAAEWVDNDNGNNGSARLPCRRALVPRALRERCAQELPRHEDEGEDDDEGEEGGGGGERGVGRVRDGVVDSHLNVEVESSVVSGLGKFTLYRDGTTRAVFEDRALLSLSPARDVARVLLPSGKHVTVRVANAAECEAYVRATVAFAEWASLGPAGRARRLQEEEETRRSVAAHLSSVSRYLGISETMGLGHNDAAAFGASKAAALAAVEIAALPKQRRLRQQQEQQQQRKQEYGRGRDEEGKKKERGELNVGGVVDIDAWRRSTMAHMESVEAMLEATGGGANAIAM